MRNDILLSRIGNTEIVFTVETSGSFADQDWDRELGAYVPKRSPNRRLLRITFTQPQKKRRQRRGGEIQDVAGRITLQIKGRTLTFDESREIVRVIDLSASPIDEPDWRGSKPGWTRV